MVFSVGVIIMFTAIIICIISPYTFATDTPYSRRQQNRLRRSRSQASKSQASTSRASTSRASSSQTIPPLVPTVNEPGVIYKNCLCWIHSEHFTYDDQNNRVMKSSGGTFSRVNIESLWVVGYMYGLNHADTEYFQLWDFTPKKFCDRHVPDNAYYPFVSLEGAEFTCQGWINIYGNDHTSTIDEIVSWAAHRDTDVDNNISIWAVGYFKFITSKPHRRDTTSTRFCSQMGQAVADLPTEYPFMRIDGYGMSPTNNLDFAHFWDEIRWRENSLNRLPFMTYQNKKCTCKEWIELIGYTDDLGHNSEKIGNQDIDFDDFLPHFAKLYVVHIRDLIKREKAIPLPGHFCTGCGHFSNQIFYYDGTLFFTYGTRGGNQ